MGDDDFEWDDVKAASNVQKHGVSFEMARGAFKDAFSVDWIDDRQDTNEERLVILGMVENRLIHVAYTMRGERVRVISARKAEPQEQRKYHDDNQT